MKKIVKMMAVLGLLSGLFGVVATRTPEVKAEAANTETKRVWLHTTYVSWWDGDLANALVGVHYWGGTSGSDWAGVQMSKDNANNLWYFDVPSDTTTVKFTRIKASDPTGEPYNKSVNTDLPVNPNLYRFELWNDIVNGEQAGVWVEFTPDPTTKVANFAATIDTSDEACSSLATQAAVNAYNALSTFEQNQFNDLDVGEGVTGLQRLNYLISFYGIDTPIGSSVPGRIPSSDNSATATLIISALGVSSLAGYYFISKKKLFG
jgi:hypothetical protein